MNNNPTKSKSRVTIKDVAKAADVSIATVSYVLNNKPGQSIGEDTRKKVLQFANLLGYECNVMAKYLASGKTNTVTALIKDFTPFASQYYLKLLTELSSMLGRQNYGLKIVNYSDGIKRNADCDAYLTIGLSEKEFRAFADTKYVPVIAVDSIFKDFLFYLINDDYEALYKNARSETDAEKIVLLSYELPYEVEQLAKSFFDDVLTVSQLSDISLDGDTFYVTVCKAIYDNVDRSRNNVRLESSSFALKAAAATEAIIKAINRTTSNEVEHNIKV